jgi:hypothetical protein
MVARLNAWKSYVAGAAHPKPLSAKGPTLAIQIFLNLNPTLANGEGHKYLM